MSLQTSIEDLKAQIISRLAQAETREDLERFHLEYLTKKGLFQQMLKEVGRHPPDQRAAFGARVNALRDEIEALLAKQQIIVEEKEIQRRLNRSWDDPTLPGRLPLIGGLHPVTQFLDRILVILEQLGFSIHMGPNLDDEYHNFSALNFPNDHPARDMQDTFYLNSTTLLRTQTSSMQIRLMKCMPLPLRVAVPGRCFRNETVTSRSHFVFHQFEGLYINQGVSVTDLIGTLEAFYQRLFDHKVTLRIRPSYFPFVEPGFEVDLACLFCSGNGCMTCKHSGWLEVAGAGMVHPAVLKEGGIDPERYTGFAWGMGIERMLMMRLGIQDIRLFTQGNIHFLNQLASLP